jgi:hypothetical protein
MNNEPERRYVKLTTESYRHRGHHYKPGLNTDHLHFNPIPECSEGGLYFCRYEDAQKWIRYRHELMHWIWDVEIPKGEKVVDMGDKLKAHRIILSNKRCIWLDKDLCMKIVKYNGYMLRFVKNPTEDMRIAAVSNYRYAIMHINRNDQTEEICLASVKLDGSALLSCAYKTNTVCMEAIKNDPRVIRLIKNKTEEMCLTAVEQDGILLMYIEIEQQTDRVCTTAVEQNPYALKYVKDKVLQRVLQYTGSSRLVI